MIDLNITTGNRASLLNSCPSFLAHKPRDDCVEYHATTRLSCKKVINLFTGVCLSSVGVCVPGPRSHPGGGYSRGGYSSEWALRGEYPGVSTQYLGEYLCWVLRGGYSVE